MIRPPLPSTISTFSRLKFASSPPLPLSGSRLYSSLYCFPRGLPSTRPLSACRHVSTRPRPPSPDRIRFWPFFLVFALGFGSYALLVQKRKDMASQSLPTEAAPVASVPVATATAADAIASTGPAFSPKQVTVLFVLGGPGVGKGTQCARLVREYGFAHLSAGDLLREEQDRPGSPYAQLIREYIPAGTIIPKEITIALLKNAIDRLLVATSPASGQPLRVLIDGFPRKMDQALEFEEKVCPAVSVLFFEAPVEVLVPRILERAKTSGRTDDNEESLRKRMDTFAHVSMPVIEYFEEQGRVERINAEPDAETVFQTTAKIVEKLLPQA